MLFTAASHPDDMPGSLGRAEAVARRRVMLGGCHMAELNAYSRRLADRSRAHVPEFDPLDGGAAAKLLFLFGKPGPESVPPSGSGFASCDNDPAGAMDCRAAMAAAGVPRQATVLWNAVPRWNGTPGHTGSGLPDGADELLPLVRVLPRLRGIVLVGAVAQAHAWPVLDGIGLLLFRSVHIPPPSIGGPDGRERRARVSEAWRDAWLKVA